MASSVADPRSPARATSERPDTNGRLLPGAFLRRGCASPNVDDRDWMRGAQAVNEQRALIEEPVQTLDSRAFWWTNPLLNCHVHDFASASCLFTGNSAAARLDRSGTVAVVTGQQAGLFGGWT